MENKTVGKGRKIFAVIMCLALMLAVLRLTHIILRVGGVYTTCFASEFPWRKWEPDDKNISEIRYMKRAKEAVINGLDCQELTNIDFLADFTTLERVYIFESNETISIPSLKNSHDLKEMFTFQHTTDDLDFIADNPELELISVQVHERGLKDISGLRNKPALSQIIIDTACTDFSVLGDMPALERLAIEGSKKEECTGADDDFIFPSLKSSVELNYVNIENVEISNLDFIADNKAIEKLTVHPEYTQITDISGLKGKTKLKELELYNVSCTDFSVLRELTALKKVTIAGSTIPEDIVKELEKRYAVVKNPGLEEKSE
ncbi:MAG: hypothetical protein J5501_06960 [Ruminococcus sp.]|nr:hypothetical protein [Ruminococcus sp.]